MNIAVPSLTVGIFTAWIMTGVLIARKALRVASLSSVCHELEAQGLGKPEWKPFFRFENKHAVIQGKFLIFIRALVFGPFKFGMTLTYVFISFIATILLPPRGVAAVARWVARSILSTLGLDMIQHGTRAKSSVAPLLVANHISAMDILAVLSVGGCFVANDSVCRLPCVGAVSAAIGCIFVGRDSSSSRSTAREAVAHRLKGMMDGSSKVESQLVVFPEGTTTNGLGILEFRRGSFESAVPIQPVRIEYSNLQCSMAMVNIFELLSFLSVMPNSTISVTYLPIVTPTAGEPAEAVAARCRAVIKADNMESYGLQTHRDEIELLAFLRSDQFGRSHKKSN